MKLKIASEDTTLELELKNLTEIIMAIDAIGSSPNISDGARAYQLGKFAMLMKEGVLRIARALKANGDEE